MSFKLPNGEDLSVEQTDIINLPTTKDWVIKGGPGTGKTVMAIYRAGQASAISKDKNVIMLVYNRTLKEFLSTAIQSNSFKNVEIYTIHSWINNIYKELGSGPVPKEGKWFVWEKVEAEVSPLGKKYSHAIIDEAQDFPVELLRIIKKISDNITCFIDPNQAIEIGKTDVYDAIKTLCVEAPYKLTKNFRNTKPIRELSVLFCKDGEPAPSSMPGRKPVITKVDSKNFDDQDEKIVDIIKKNKEKEIGIIVNNSAQNNIYKSMNDKLPNDVKVQMYKSNTRFDIHFDEPGVKILSYGTMKGLEFDVVILPMFDKIRSKDDETVDSNRTFVAVSRAINELYIFYFDEETRPRKIKTMETLTSNRSLLEWR